MKRAALRACVLIAAFGFVLFGGSGCRGRDEAMGPAGSARNHSKASPSSSSSLPFVPLSFDEALARAGAEKKLVLVDVYTDWCGWCTKMDRDVFTDARVRTALLAFVPIRMNAEKGDGRRIASRYRVNGLPTFLLVDGDGRLVGRFEGYFPADVFLRRLDASSGARG